MRKVISMIVAIAMLVTMFSTVVNLGTASAATQDYKALSSNGAVQLAPAGFTVNVDSVSGKNGTEVVVPINFENVPSEGISTADMSITYDSTKLEYVGIAPGSIVTNPSVNFASNKESDGQLKILFLDYTMANGFISEDGSFAKLTFKVKTSAVTSAKVSISKSTFGDQALETVASTVNDGAVALNGGEATTAPTKAPTTSPAVTSTAAPTGFTAYVGSVSGNNGDEIVVPVGLSNVPSNGIGTADMTIEYDSTKLEYVSVAAGSIVTNPGVNFASNKESDGKIKMLFLDYTMADGYIKESGVFAKITFKVKTSSATTTDVSIAKSTFGDKTLEAISTKTTAGKITLNGSISIPTATAVVTVPPAKTTAPVVKTIAPEVTSKKTTPPTGFTAYVDEASGNVGDTIVVPVKFINVPSKGITTANMTIVYDASKLEYVSGEAGDIVTDPTNNFGINKESDGKVKSLFLDLSMTDGYISQDGVYANLTFKVKASAAVSTSVSLSNATFGDKDLGSISAKLSAGIIALNGGGAYTTPDVSTTAKPSGFTVYVDKASGNMGDEIVVPVGFVNVPSTGASAIDMAVIYDSSKLEYVSGAAGSIVTDPTVNFAINKETDGKVKLLFLDYTMDSGAIKQDGVFANLTFKVKTSSAVSTNVSLFNATIGDKDLVSLNAKLSAGTIALNGGGPTSGSTPIIAKDFTAAVGTVEANTGDQIEVPVQLAKVPSNGITTADMTITYDSSKLQYVSGEAGEIVTDPTNNFGINKETDGTIKILFLDYTMKDGYISQDGVFAKLIFKVKATEKTSASIAISKATFGDVQLSPISAKLLSGGVSINGGGEPTSVVTTKPTPTVKVTPKPTPTAKITAKPVNSDLKVEFTNSGNTQAQSNSIYPKFKLTNTGSNPINLSDVKLRYYFTVDGDKTQSFWCDWSPVGSSNVSGTFVKIPSPVTGADQYLEISFNSAAGSLAANTSIDVQCRFAKSDWSNYNQADDYSLCSSAGYTAWDKVTAYIAGDLVWGVDPINGAVVTEAPKTEAPTPTKAKTPTPTSTKTGKTPTPTVTFNPNAFKVEVASVSGEAGDTVVVPVNLSKVPSEGVSTADMTIEYDAANLEYVSGEAGSIVTNPSVNFEVNKETNGILKVLFLDYTMKDGYISEDGTFANLTFKIKSTAKVGTTSAISITKSTFGDNALTTLPAVVIAGKVEVIDGSAMKVVIGKVTGEAGKEVVVPVSIEGISTNGVATVDMTIDYDSDKLEYVSGEAGSIVTDPTNNYAINNVADAGQVKILFLDYTMKDGYISKDGVFTNLTFKIKSTLANGTVASVTKSAATFGDKDLATLNVVISNGSVTVGKSVETPTPTNTTVVTPTPTNTAVVTPTNTTVVTPTPTNTAVVTPTNTAVVTPIPTGFIVDIGSVGPVEKGDEVVVPVTLRNVPEEGVSTANITITYDATKLEYVSGAPGSIVTNPSVNFALNQTEGKIKVLFLDYTMENQYISKDGTFIELTFKAIGDDGLTEISGSEETFADKELATIKTSVINGGVNIGPGTVETYKITGYIDPDFITTSTTAPIVKAGFKVELVGTNDSAVTDSNGYFVIETTSKGTYTVKITKDNYLTREIADVSVEGDKELSTSASPIIMWAGDMVINGEQDGAINLEDIMEVCKAFNTASTDDKYKVALDLNRDGAVNLEDVMIVAKHFNKVSSNY